MENNEKRVDAIQDDRKSKKRERKEAEKKAQQKTATKNKVIVICVIAVLAIFILLALLGSLLSSGVFSRSITAVSSDNFKVNSSMMTYFFNVNYQNIAGQYGEALGLDTSKSLKEQNVPEGLGTTGTWFDYFMDSTRSQVNDMLVLCEGAKEAGIELEEEDLDEINETIKSYKDAAKSYSVSADSYVKRVFGTAVNLNDIKNCLKLSALASKYANKVSSDYEYTADDYKAYFEENKDEYQYVDYLKYTFAATADSEGKYADEDKAAMKEKSDALLATSTVDGFKTYIKDYLTEKAKAEAPDAEVDEESINSQAEGLLTTHVNKAAASTAADWAFDSARKVGDTFVDGDDETGSYTVYMIAATEYIDDYKTKNGAYIYISNSTAGDEASALAKADEAIAEWEAGDKTAESFLALTETYSDAGHLHEIVKNIKKDQPFSDLLYKEGITAGTVDKIVSTDSSNPGVFVIYYDGESDLAGWEADVDTALRSEQYEKDHAALTEKFEGQIKESSKGINMVMPIALG